RLRLSCGLQSGWEAGTVRQPRQDNAPLGGGDGQGTAVWFEDEGGVATIHSEAFRVALTGHSFGSHSRGGNYVVDGRYGSRLFSGPESDSVPVGDGVICDYSQRQRLCTFHYQGHVIAYSHALKKLTVDGREYSTADGQVHLLLKENGEVELVDR